MNNETDNRDGYLYITGTRGYSAYEVAVQNGYSGTEEEWLESLVGPQGPQGIDGKSAYDVAVENGYSGTVEDWLNDFLTPDGYIAKRDIVDDLTTVDNKKVLSAKQGKILKELADGNSTNILINATNINNERTERATADLNLQNQINSLSSGSPKGSYSTVSALESANPDTGVYIVTGNGHIYSWIKDGTTATDLGQYQSTGIEDESIYLKHLNKDILGNKYHYKANKNYPEIVFILPESKNASTIESIRLKGTFKNVGANFSDPLLKINVIQPNWWYGGKSFPADMFNLKNIENNKEYKLDLTVNIDTPLASQKFSRIGIQANTGTAKAYEFYFENLEIFLNGEKLNYLTLVTSDDYSDESEFLSYLATKKYVANVINPIEEKITADLEMLKKYDVMSKSDLLNITCWGDSLTEGGANDGLSYPAYLQNLVGNRITINNKGVAGQCSGTVAFRQGGNVVKTNEDFVIPASNSESVSFKIVTTNHNMNSSAQCTINGVAGTIVFTDDNNASFKRISSGEILNVETGTQIFSSQAIYDDNLVIIWVGRNDMAFAWPYQISGPIVNVKSMIDRLTPTIKRFLVVSCTTTTNEETGGQSFGWVTELNNNLRTAYPNNFVDIQNYLVNECIYDAGITPTDEDLQKMSKGTIPPSLMFDFVHPNAIARQYVAQYIYNELKSKGWIA